MPETQFTRLGTTREVAYCRLSMAPGDAIVLIPSGTVPIEVLDEDPAFERFIRTLGGYGRLLAFDPPGRGASDAFDPELDYVDQVADAYVAVLDAEQVDAAWVVTGDALGGVTACRFTARHPHRLLGGAVLNPPGLPAFERGDAIPSQEQMLDRGGDEGFDMLRHYMPSRADDPAFQAWYERAGRLGASAAAARALYDAGLRAGLAYLAAPDQIDHPRRWLLVRRRQASTCGAEDLSWWQGHLPGAEVEVLEGADTQFHGLDAALVAHTFGAHFTGERLDTSDEDRQLLAVLFTDLVASTEQVSRRGDERWRAVLDEYERQVTRIAVRHGGRVVKHTGDGALATFTTGSRALAAAGAIRSMTRDLGLESRFGVHVGEVESRGDDVGGVAVHLAARVMGQARPGQILATSTVVQVTSGGSWRFAGVGRVELRGIDGPSELHEVVVPAIEAAVEPSGPGPDPTPAGPPPAVTPPP